MGCVSIQNVCKLSTETIPWGFNFVVQLSRRWAPSGKFDAATRALPSKARLQTGYEYESSGGISNGAAEPRWPTVTTGPKSVVKDGPITWTTKAISGASLQEHITDTVWDVPAGITFAEDAFVDDVANQFTGGKFSGGKVGDTYTVTGTIITNLGNRYSAQLVIEVH